MAGVIGQRHFDRAGLLRRELLAITGIFVTAVGATILLWNRSFVHLWVGAENYAGAWTNMLIVLVMLQAAFIRCDAYVIDAALQPARRVRVGIVAALLTLGLMIGLTHLAGMMGLCIGILLGRATQSVGYPLLVRGCLEGSRELSLSWLARPLVVMALIFAGTSYLGEQLLLANWLSWVVAVALTLPAAATLALMAGLPPGLRTRVAERMLDAGRRVGLKRT
jgi:hypothetical protein